MLVVLSCSDISVFQCLYLLCLLGAAPFAVAVGADAVAMLCSLSILALLAVSAQWFNVAGAEAQLPR